MVKILWVDDEVELLKPHVLFLQQKGYEVDTCNNGYDAIDMASEGAYDLIILDPPAYGRGANGEKWILEDNIGEMLDCCARLLAPAHAFLVLNLYSMGLSSTLARTAVRQAFGAPRDEEWGELTFTDRGGKELPLGTYYRFVR